MQFRAFRKVRVRKKAAADERRRYDTIKNALIPNSGPDCGRLKLYADYRV